MKRLLAICLTLIVMTSMISVTTFAETESVGSGGGAGGVIVSPVTSLKEKYNISYYTGALSYPWNYTASKITSTEELAVKFSSEELKTKYTEEFFEDKFLYTIGYEAYDGSYSVSVESVDVKENLINIKATAVSNPGTYIDMVIPWSIIIEFDNSYLDKTFMSEVRLMPADIVQQNSHITLKSQFPWPTMDDPAIINPLERYFVSGGAEDGVGEALHLYSGTETADPTFTQYVIIPDTFNLTGVDVIRLRYKSTASIDTYFTQIYDMPAGYVLSAGMAEDVKGILGDDYSTYFDNDGKCIKKFVNEAKSDLVTLPSTDGVWKTIDIPITDFGDKEFLNTMHSVMELIGIYFDMPFYEYVLYYNWEFTGAEFNAESGKDIMIDSFTGLWEKAGVTKADLSNDGIVNNTDFAQLKNFIELEVTPDYYPAADVNQDGHINNTDIAIIKNYIELDKPIN